MVSAPDRRACRWRLLRPVAAALVLTAWGVAIFPASARQITIEVAPGGQDRIQPDALASEARVGPVRSLAYAVTLAREVRRRQADVTAITIALAPGIHRLEAPVRLGPEDSGATGRPLVIRGNADGSSVLRGSVIVGPEPGVVRGYERLGPAARTRARLYRLPESASIASNIDTARPQSVSVLVERHAPTTIPSVPFEVFDSAGAMRPARWPNAGWARVVGPAGDGWWSFTTDAPRLDAWRGEPDLWAGGYWKWDYSYERHRVGEVGLGTLTLTTPFVFGLKNNARFHVYHALAELDEPGEWYRDRAAGTLIAWSRGETTAAPRIELSVVESAIVSEGASHVRISDLTIERFHGDGIRVVGGSDVVIERSTLRWTGLRGASFIDASDSGIVASDITDTGEGGVLLSGGDRRMLAPAGLYVRSCRIVRFNRIALSFKPAVDIHGVGNVVSGSYIAEAPNIGIMLQGNDHLVEGNEIANVVTDTTDSGALYTGHDWTARGTIIRNNFFHDIRARGEGFEVKGVYLDDFTSGITVRGNLFLRVDQPVFLGGGRDNLVEGNVFVASHPALHVDARGLDWASKYVKDPSSDLRRRLSAVPYASAAWRARYPQLATLLIDEPGDAKRNASRGNVIVGGKPYFLETRAELRKQSLGPDLVAGAGPLGIGPSDEKAAGEARSADDIEKLIGPQIAKAGGPLLPYTVMDRQSRAGRPPPDKR